MRIKRKAFDERVKRMKEIAEMRMEMFDELLYAQQINKDTNVALCTRYRIEIAKIKGFLRAIDELEVYF